MGWSFSGTKGSSLLSILLLTLHPILGVDLSAQELAFPYQVQERDWVWAWAGGGLAFMGWYLHGEGVGVGMDEIRALDPASINVFDRGTTQNWSPTWGHRSDQFRMVVMGGAALYLGGEGLRAAFDGRADDALTLGALLGEAALLTAGATYLTKVMVGRRRPFLYNGELSVEERYQIASSGGDNPTMSFFSGHSSAAFAAATFASSVFQDIHGTSAWSNQVWGSTLSLAGLTAYGRVKAGVHFPTDVIVGALVGGSIGYLVPRLHHRDERDDPGDVGGGLMLSYSFRF